MTEYSGVMMNQDRTPLIDAMAAFIKRNPAFFRVPGHRFERGVDEKALALIGSRAFQADLTEAEGLDDLHHPAGAILESERLAAELYGSDRCWFLVNGTTSGNEAMILSAVGPGEKILISRDAHRSALQGLVLSGAVPVWITPPEIPGWNLTGSVDPEKIREALDRDSSIRAVYLTSPTYYGVRSDIRTTAEICHEHGVPLLIDEAHGAHLYFDSRMYAPKGAISCGADLAAQSTHKTCGSMTGSSMLHLKGKLISPERVDACVKLVTTTSPNYVMMASLDGARHRMAMKGQECFRRAYRLRQKAAAMLEDIPGVSVLNFRSDAGMYGLDPLRLVFSAREAGIRGYDLQRMLYDEGNVSCELSDPDHVVCVITSGNTDEEIEALAETCRKAVETYGRQSTDKTDGTEKPWAPADLSAPEEQQMKNFLLRPMPELKMTPREAFYSRTETVSLADAVGRVAAESFIPYPPGIPVICPGEVLSHETAEEIITFSSLEMNGQKAERKDSFRVVVS